MNTGQKYRFTRSVLLTAGLVSTAAVMADAVLEEIVVTASKRGAVSVQDVAGGVRAISGEFMEKHSLRTVEDIARLEPSLQISKAAAGDLQPIIRGIQSPGAGTVGVYFDETIITGANFSDGGGRTPDIGAYDIERVEILKGPQGTLFGASSMSGTVRFISNKPDASGVDANIRVGGNLLKDGDAGFNADAMFNLPVIDDVLALRGVAWHETRGGFIDHYTGLNGVTENKDADEVTRSGGRLMGRYTPNAELTIDAYVMYQELEADGPPGYSDIPTGVGLDLPVIVPPFVFANAVAAAQAGVYADRKISTPAVETNDNEVLMYGATLEYDLGFGSVVGTISNFDLDNFSGSDTSGVATAFGLIDAGQFFGPPFQAVLGNGFLLAQNQDREVLSAELRFSSDFEGPLNFVGGFFYTEDDSQTQTLVALTDPVTGLGLCSEHSQCIADPASAAAQTIVFGTDKVVNIESFALFGHVDYELTEAWTLSGGLRYYESDERDRFYTLQAFQGSAVFTFPPAFGGPVQTVPLLGLDAKNKESEVNWEAGLSYQYTDNQLYYFKAATGFRQGGLNDSNAAAQLGAVIPTTFDPDTVTSLEFGAKTTWLNDRLTLNATYFKMFWEDIQVPGQDPTGSVNYVDNAARAEIDGVEVEMFARPTEQWLMSLGLTWMDAALTRDQLVAAGPFGLKGDNIPKAPEWAFSGSIEYLTPFPLIDNVDLALRSNFSYTGESERFFNNTFQGNAEIGDYFLLNLSADFNYKNWVFRLYSNNVTDEVPRIDIFGSGNDAQHIITAEPRSFGAQIQWNFK